MPDFGKPEDMIGCNLPMEPGDFASQEWEKMLLTRDAHAHIQRLNHRKGF